VIVDGSGEPSFNGSIGIRDGLLTAVGEAPGDAEQTIDAQGHIVAPGFVDIHTHYDAQILWDRMLTISPWHGVTTVVMGNCGFSVAPTRPEHRDMIIRTLENVEGMTVAALQEGLGAEWPFETFPQYLDAIESRGTAINVGAMIGHTALRTYVMGESATEREATADEIRQMQEIVDEAMTAGAIELTRTPVSARSLPNDFVMPITAALLAEYAAAIGLPSLPAIDAMFTIRP